MTPDHEWRDPRNWRGLLYVAPRDPRVIVPKRNPAYGWTFNFAHPWRCAVLAAAIVGAALGIVSATVSLAPTL